MADGARIRGRGKNASSRYRDDDDFQHQGGRSGGFRDHGFQEQVTWGDAVEVCRSRAGVSGVSREFYEHGCSFQDCKGLGADSQQQDGLGGGFYDRGSRGGGFRDRGAGGGDFQGSGGAWQLTFPTPSPSASSMSLSVAGDDASHQQIGTASPDDSGELESASAPVVLEEADLPMAKWRKNKARKAKKSGAVLNIHI